MAINEVNIGDVILHAVVFDPKNSERLEAMDLHQLLQSVPRLFELFEQRNVDYVLVGGIAMLVYIRGRNTQDIDVIVASDGLERLPEVEIVEKKGEFVRGRLGDLQVDMLLTENKLFDKVRREHTVRQHFVEREILCATVEGLMLLKLFALPSLYRQADFHRVRIYENDVADLLEVYGTQIEPLLEELSAHLLASDLAEVREIVRDIEDRIAKSRRRFSQE